MFGVQYQCHFFPPVVFIDPYVWMNHSHFKSSSKSFRGAKNTSGLWFLHALIGVDTFWPFFPDGVAMEHMTVVSMCVYSFVIVV